MSASLEGWQSARIHLMATEKEVKEIKSKNSAFILGLPGVVGIGVAQDDSGSYGLIVHVDSADPEVLRKVSEQLQGCTVKIEQTGRFRKL
jgi:hypothetical protein